MVLLYCNRDDVALIASGISNAVVHEPVGNPGGPGLWHHKNMQLPAYVQHIANDLIEGGMDTSRAIATAVSRCKVWCAGGQHVTPETKAKACLAIAEWEKLKAQSRAESTKAAMAAFRASWNSALHPRAPAGSPGGGEFATGATTAAPTKDKPLGTGAASPQVSDLQKRLAALGYRVKVDGQFGPETKAAVEAFQRANGITVDGLVGPQTTAALRNHKAVRSHGTPKPHPGRKSGTTRKSPATRKSGSPASGDKQPGTTTRKSHNKTGTTTRKPAANPTPKPKPKPTPHATPKPATTRRSTSSPSKGHTTKLSTTHHKGHHTTPRRTTHHPAHHTTHHTTRKLTPAQRHAKHLKHVAHLEHLISTGRATPAQHAELARLKKLHQAAAGDAMTLMTVPDVDLMAAGTWKLASGRQTFTRKDVTDAIDAAKCPAVGNPVIKIGHTDTRFVPGDGEPALGTITNMHPDASGVKLRGDLADVPAWLGEIMASAYPQRSIEGSYDFKCQIGHTHPFVVSALALLGVTKPGVGVLSDLADLRRLYGDRMPVKTAAAEKPWSITYQEGEAIVPVTEEDVRRAYYAGADIPQTWWITELQMNPAQLVVSDGDGNIYQVPFDIENEDTISFGEAAQLESYAQLAASRGSGEPLFVFASADESRDLDDDEDDDDGDELDDEDDDEDDDDYDPDEQVEAAAAAPYGDVPYADPKNKKYPVNNADRARAAWSYINKAANAAKYPLNGVTLTEVKNKIIAACKKFGVQVSAASDPPANEGGADQDSVTAAGHAAMAGSHSHAHPAYGSQGGDATHTHQHSHQGDAVHQHAHATAAGAGKKEGASDVEFTDEQIAAARARLGLADDTELTPQLMVDGIGKRVAASVPQGAILIDKNEWEAINARVKRGEEFQAKQRVKERDTVIEKAVRDGKFSAARKPHYVRIWDSDPEGAREVIAGLAKNVVPVSDVGTPGGVFDDELLDDEYKSLFPPGTVH